MTEVSILVLLSFTASSFNFFFFRFLWFGYLAVWLLQFLMHCCGHCHLEPGFMSACKVLQLGVGELVTFNLQAGDPISQPGALITRVLLAGELVTFILQAGDFVSQPGALFTRFLLAGELVIVFLLAGDLVSEPGALITLLLLA